MKISKYSKLLTTGVFLGTILTGCGGGGGGGDTTTPSTPTTPTDTPKTTVSGTITKGILVNAKVCVDENKNNKCDSNEPFDTTDVNGKYSITADVTTPILVESTSSSLDKSTGKPFVGFLYGSGTSGTVNNVTMFTTISKIISDNNLPAVDFSAMFGIDTNYLDKDYLTTSELNTSEKDKLEQASQYLNQFISTIIEDLSDNNVNVNSTDPDQYYTVAKGLANYLSANPTKDLSNLSNDLNLTKTIKKSIVTNISNDANSDINLTDKLTLVNNTIDTNTTVFESIDSVTNELGDLLKSLYAVPVLETNGSVASLMNHQLHDFNIISYDEALGDSNITITGMIDNSSFSVVLELDKDNGIYGGKVDDTKAFAFDLNFKQSGMTNSGMVLSFAEDTNNDDKTDSISYWALSTKETICTEYKDTIGLNSINNYYTTDISCD